MYYGTINNTAITAGNPFVFVTKYLTNNNVTYANGVFTFRRGGYYRIHFDMSAVASASGVMTPTLYLNGVATTTYASETGDTTQTNNLGFETIVKINDTYLNQNVTMSVVLSTTGATIQDSNFVIERIA